MARELLTEQMLELMTVCFRNIVVEHLDEGHRERYLSIKQQFELDKRLSPAQCDVIKRYKLVSDYKNRQIHLDQYGTFDKERLVYKRRGTKFKLSGRY